MSAGPAATPTRRRRWLLAQAGAVALMAAAPFANCAGHQFIAWDDPIIILEQPFLRELTAANLWQIASPFPARDEWLPLRDLTLALNFACFGPDPGWFLAGNVLLHAATAVAALLVLRRLLRPGLPAFAAALLFACHAVHVESVTWLSARKDPLSALFMLLALLAWTRLRDGGGGRAWAAALACFAAALLSKASAFVLPAWLLAYDLLYHPGLGWRARLAPLAPLCALGAAHVLLYVKLTALDGVIEPYPAGGLPTVLFSDLTFLLDYLRDLVLPLRHQAIYEPRFVTSLGLELVLPVLALAAQAAIAWRLRRAAPWVALAVIVFHASLLPFMNLIPHGIYYAERYLYLPSLAYALVLGGLAARARRLATSERAARLALCAFVVLHALLHAQASWRRNEVWRDSRTFWTYQATQLPGNPAPLMNLGESHEMTGQDAEAEAVYRAILAAGLEVPDVHYRLARLARRRGDLPAAITAYERYVGLAPDEARGKNNLAEAYLASGDAPRALATYERVLREHPEYLLGRANLARVLEVLGRPDEAAAHWRVIVERADQVKELPLRDEALRRLRR